jgi:uroporphyrinogen decarboxylase
VYLTIDTGIDGFQFAERNDPAVICGLIDDRCVVMGGTDIVPTLYSGTEEAIRCETERYLKACSGNRYIFSCSCSLQRGVPLKNILEMCRYVNG